MNRRRRKSRQAHGNIFRARRPWRAVANPFAGVNDNRLPRRDFVNLIARLNFRQLARAVRAADYYGITIEMHVRRRWATCARALLGATWGRSHATATN